MACSSCLVDDRPPLILDTSVLINLHASSSGRQILANIPNDIFVSDTVVRELDHETSHSKGDNNFIHGLISQAVVSVVQLDEQSYQLYEQLISGSGSLDDGEAATIATAVTSNFIPIIDERKGRTKARILVGDRVVAWSLDLFLHPSVKTGLPHGDFIEAVYLALREGRMRIDEERCDAVVELIGIERALHCTSLPRFKARKKLWSAFAD